MKNQDNNVRSWIPQTTKGKWFFANCVNEHWILVEYQCESRTLTQYDTLGDGTNTMIASRLKQYIETARGIRGIVLKARQPIVQQDGFNCGLHVIELICQLARSKPVPTTYLTRLEICEKLIDFGFTAKYEGSLENLADPSIIVGGGPTKQTEITKFFRTSSLSSTHGPSRNITQTASGSSSTLTSKNEPEHHLTVNPRRREARESILPCLSSTERILEVENRSTPAHKVTFVPKRANKMFRIMFQNLNTLKLYHENEVKRNLEFKVC